MLKFEINSLAELENFTGRLINEILNNSVVAFYGPMGSGKTTLIKYLCEKMHVTDTVTSPTFSIINEYATEKGDIVYHFDFYRINKSEEIFDLGYEEYFFSGNKCFIEWPEKIDDYLPSGTVRVIIKIISETTREIEIIK